jgi:hypothetical protein
MKNNLFIQKSQVSTLSKNPNGLFDLKKWATNLLTDYGVIAGDPCCVSGSTGVSGNISEARYSVFTGIQASGVTEVDATVLDYGVNLVEIADSSNIAVKLPQPVTGKSTKIINMTLLPIYVFPSNVGGKINNLPVDTPQTIPADGKVYEFICTENPFPGNWNILNSPSTGSFSYQISVTHTHGTNTLIAIDSSTGLATSYAGVYMANNGNNTFTLNPSTSVFKTFSTPTTATYLKVYTNIIPSDLTGTNFNNSVRVSRGVYYMYDTGVPNQNWGTHQFFPMTVQFVPMNPGYGNFVTQVTNGSVPGSTVSIGDMNTLYCEFPQSYNTTWYYGQMTGVSQELGPIPAEPWVKSNIYNFYSISIPAVMPSKTYDFLIVQEYM